MKYRINLLMNDGERNLRKIQKNYINDKYFYQFFCKKYNFYITLIQYPFKYLIFMIYLENKRQLS